MDAICFKTGSTCHIIAPKERCSSGVVDDFFFTTIESVNTVSNASHDNAVMLPLNCAVSVFVERPEFSCCDASTLKCSGHSVVMIFWPRCALHGPIRLLLLLHACGIACLIVRAAPLHSCTKATALDQWKRQDCGC